MDGPVAHDICLSGHATAALPLRSRMVAHAKFHIESWSRSSHGAPRARERSRGVRRTWPWEGSRGGWRAHGAHHMHNMHMHMHMHMHMLHMDM